MKTVILCNSLDGLKKLLGRHSVPVRYINLTLTEEGQRIVGYLSQMPDAEGLCKEQLFRERSEKFRQKYINFFGELNVINHSLHWWAIPFTDKQSLVRPCFRDIFNFLLIVELVNISDRSLLVITDNLDLSDQIKVWSRNVDVSIVSRINQKNALKTFVKRHTPVGIVRSFVRTLVFWMMTRGCKPDSNLEEKHFLVSTVTHPSSFASPSEYKDIYFGSLIGHLSKSEYKPLVLALVLEKPLEQFKKIKSLKFGVPVVPLDACLTLKHLGMSFFQALKVYIQPIKVKGKLEIDGLDVSLLIERAVKDACHSGDVFLNIRLYYLAQWISQRISIAKCIYPFENRAWEKMLLLGMRAVSPNSLIAGYQHAAITHGHTNFMVQSKEADITPLPDTILTTGGWVKEWLTKESNYPSGIIRKAGALRQEHVSQYQPKSRNGRIRKILVALGTGLEEYVYSLQFLAKSFSSTNDYDVRIRPHPTMPLGSAVKYSGLNDREFFTVSTCSLSHDFEWADVVVYVSSTVGMEAVLKGIPAIYLDLGEPVGTDSIFACKDFKWSAYNPEDLMDIIKHIDSLPDDVYRETQKQGHRYALSYLEPVDASNMWKFWDFEKIK